MAKRIEVSWGNGGTDLFLVPCEEGWEVLDYEFDTDRIHKICGGKCYYTSHSSYSGAGYIERYAELTRVGYYRVDTVHNDFQWPVEIAEGIEIMLPYASHENDKKATLEKNPVVIRVKKNTIIYCGFYTNMKDVLVTLLSRQELEQEARVLRKNFVNTRWKCEQVVELKLYNLFGYSSFYPWEFAKELLLDYIVVYPKERIHSIFHISACEDGTLVRTTKIGQMLYATEIVDGDPCEKLETPFRGWELARSNMLYKLREKDVYIVGWEPSEAIYQKKIERIARFIPESEAEEFKAFVSGALPLEKYVEFEITVPKLLFLLNKEEQFANVCKGITQKVRTDVFTAARNFVNETNDKQILEEIPDNLIITLEDSYDSGNCKPGTQAFVDQYFPRRVKIKAGELKKHADNWNVMRIFRYIAARDLVKGGKVDLEFPD